MVVEINIWEPEGKARGSLVIVHGLGEHSKRYNNFAVEIAKAGYKVITGDLPGHGVYPGPRGHVKNIEVLFERIDEFMRETVPPVHLFGHSMGGLIALRYAQVRNVEISSLILSSPALCSRMNVFVRFIACCLGVFAPRLRLKNGIDVNMLSRNSEAVERYINDPLVHPWITGRLASILFENMERAFHDVDKLNIPVMIVVGMKDEIVPPKGALNFYERLDGRKVLKKYEECYHEPFEDPEYSGVLIDDVLSFLNEVSE